MTDAPARIRIKEAASMLGVTPRTVQSLAGRGDLPGAAKIGKLWTFNPQKLAKFIAEKEAEIAARADWKPPPAAYQRRTFIPPSSAEKSAKAYEHAMSRLLGACRTNDSRRSENKRSPAKSG